MSQNIQHFWTWKYEKWYNLWNLLYWINDYDKVLKTKLLWPIWEFFSIRENWKKYDPIIEWSEVDKEDLLKLEEWFNKYTEENTYKSYKKWSDLENLLDKKKWDFNLMNLVEISIWKLLEYKLNLSKNWNDSVKVKTTTKLDDYKSWIDYIIEFYKNWKIDRIIWVDVTTSERWFEEKNKKNKWFSFPSDYKRYYKENTWNKLKSISKIILKIPKNIAFSYTNNFFTSVLEKWNKFNENDIIESFNYWLEDLENKNFVKLSKLDINNVMEFWKWSVKNILNGKF